MGLWSKIVAHSAGAKERIVCKTCGDTYIGNIDKRFPYSACGRCLERAEFDAKQKGDNEMCSMIRWEFQRRANLI